MFKRVIANIFLNIAIITMAFSIVWSFKNQFYTYGLIAILIMAGCIYLKVRLIKNVREITKKH